MQQFDIACAQPLEAFLERLVKAGEPAGRDPPLRAVMLALEKQADRDGRQSAREP